MRPREAPSLPPPQRAAFARLVARHFGLAFAPERAYALDAGVARATLVLHAADPAELLVRIDAGERDALDALAVELTVGETYILRDAQHFEFLRTRVLPGLAARGGPIRLWSAGCATGEEAYSLAIVARDALGAAAFERVRVVGTDLNSRSLSRAAAGWYGAWSFRDVPEPLRARWFRPESNGWRVLDEIRRAVHFEALNLLEGPSSPMHGPIFDVVFCRNVLIYFDHDAVARAAATLARGLAPSGWLVPGPSDPVLPTRHGVRQTIAPGFLVYQTEPWTPDVSTAASDGAAPADAPPARAHEASRAARRPATPRQRASPSPARSPNAPAYDEAGQLARARALADAGDVTGALALLTDLADRSLEPAVYILRATVLQAVGDDPGAVRDAERTLLLDASLAVAHVLAATSRARLGDTEGARRDLRNARGQLLALPADAPAALADGATARELLALCDAIAGTLPMARATTPAAR